MKTRTKTMVVMLLFLFIGTGVQAQFWKKLKKRAERAAEEAVIRKTEDKVYKETSQKMDTLLEGGPIGKKKKKGKKSDPDRPMDGPDQPNDDTIGETESTHELRPWTKYNFVPGDEIIFEDDLSVEENGEFPSRWDLMNGNAENAVLGEENVINMMHRAKITPLMEDEEYLPEIFTIEFDAFFKRTHGPTYQDYHITFWLGSKNYGYSDDGQSYCGKITLNMHGAYLACNDNGNAKEYSSYDESMVVPVNEPVWRHIAIAFNKRSLKVFIDEKRVLNIPNLEYKPEAFAIEAYGPYKELSAVKDIRIAKGGKKLYDRVMEEGKFITRGITFDVNKASIKPESYGVINEVATMMKEHTDLNFSIEGHTDSDGEEGYNVELSEKRAAAVKKALTGIGIDASRLETKGLGESVPVAENTSPEGKANNRRVEFIKI